MKRLESGAFAFGDDSKHRYYPGIPSCSICVRPAICSAGAQGVEKVKRKMLSYMGQCGSDIEEEEKDIGPSIGGNANYLSRVIDNFF